MNELEQKNIRPVVGFDDYDDIIFYYRDKELNKKKIAIKDFQWYFYIKTKDLSTKVKEELNQNVYWKNRNGDLILDSDSRPIKIETRIIEEGKFTKIYCKKKYSYVLRDIFEEFQIQTYEADLSMTKRYMIDNLIEIEEDLSYLFFDIETDDSISGIEIGRDVIVSWAICDGKTGENVFETDKDEKELITKLLKLFCKYDVILSWNGNQFDIPYIIERIKKLNIVDTDGKLLDENHNIWKRIMHVDMMQRCIKLFKQIMTIIGLTGFSLDEVSQHFLSKSKIERTEKIIDLFKHDLEKLKEYNIRDVQLLCELNKKLQILPLMIKECSWTGSFINKFYTGELLDNYILRHTNQQKLRLKTKPKWDSNINEKTIDIKGGYVMKPKIGFYDNVRIFDVKSMYPSIIMGWNIGQESLVEEISAQAENNFKEWLNNRKLEKITFEEWNDFLKEQNKELNRKNEYVQTGNNQFFVRKKQSVIASIIQKFLEERKRYKKILSEAEYNSIEYANAWASQEAIKELTNSVYGITAHNQSRFFDIRIAEAITLTGQFINRSSSQILKEKMGYPVIYADTDSIFTIVDDDKETLKIIKQLNQKLSDGLMKRFQVPRNIINIGYEKKFRKFILVNKKRYAGHLVEMDYKSIDNVFTKGLENVRKSSILYTRKKVTECLDLITRKDKNAEEMEEWVKNVKDEVFNCDLSAEDLAITIKMSKPTSEYILRSPHVRLAEKLIEEHKILETKARKNVWGEKIDYIIVDSNDENAVILAEDFQGQWDRRYYWDVRIYTPLMRILCVVFPNIDWMRYNINLTEKFQRQKDREQKRIENEIEKEINKMQKIKL